MTIDMSNTVVLIHEKYLNEYKQIHRTVDRIVFFQEISKIADSVGAIDWKTFADGMVHVLREDAEVALKSFDEAVEINPDFAPLWHGKGNALVILKRNEEALVAYDKSITLDPDFAYPWHGKGNALYAMNRYEDAIVAYEKAIDIDPKFLGPWHGKGTVLFKQKLFVKALASYEKAIALDPNQAPPWHGKGGVLNEMKRFEEALEAFEKAIVLEPKDPYPWNGKGNVLRKLKRYDEALAAYEKAIILDPRIAYPWNGKGNVLLDLKQHNAALTAYEKAITLDPGFAHPWNGKGTVLLKLKRYDEALAAQEKSISLDPKFAPSWNGKGNVLLKMNHHNEALVAYEKSIELDSKDANPWSGKGYVLSELKRDEEALKAYEEAIALDPELARVQYNIGLLYWRKNELSDAVEAFRRAIEGQLETEWRRVAEIWISRASRILKSKVDETEQIDRSSEEALVTELFEALKDELSSISDKKLQFKKRIAESVGRPRIVGKGSADNLLLVLRDWNSFSPLLGRKIRFSDDQGPDERRGGGYFLMWKGHGIVVDPGVDFVTQLYLKGLSITDIDTVIVTHCHLDHIRDVESLVDLNYRFNQARGFKPHSKNNDFRQLKFLCCDSAFTKYSEYLKISGCCLEPKQLERGGDARSITDFIDIKAIPVEHYDINGRDNESIGLLFSLSDENGLVVRVGLTSDSRWNDSLSEDFKGCNVLVAHLGTIEVGEDQAIEPQKKMSSNDDDIEGFLRIRLKNHLGTKGCFRLMWQVKPRIFIVGEFGEELVETRFKILKVFHQLKPKETQLVLGGDSNWVQPEPDQRIVAERGRKKADILRS